MGCFFSIVIPAYNSENHLNKCLKSVLEQRFESFEIIIIDDGSVDNTYEIAKISVYVFDKLIKVRNLLKKIK